MNNINTQIHDGRVDRAAMIRYYEQRTVGKVNLVIDGHVIRVDELIKKSKLQGKDYNYFLKSLDKEIAATVASVHNVSSRSLLDLANDQVNFTANNLDKAVSNIWRTARPPRRISEDIVLNQPIFKNTTLEESWHNIGKNERVRIDSIIRKGIAEGQTEGAIADTVMKTGFNVTRNQAQGLVVTATTHVYSQADSEVYKANAKLITGWQFVAVLDSRTTPICSYLDGKTFPADDTEHLPPRHHFCRSTTTPIVKSYDDLSKLEGVSQIRKRNLATLSEKEIMTYDAAGPLKESYSAWLTRQPDEVVLRHLGDTKKLELFRNGQLTVDKFSNPEGNSIGIRELRRLTDSGYGTAGDTRRFAIAKEKLDTIKLGAARPDEIYEDAKLQSALQEYYMLQVGELDGTMSLTNYRGTLLHNKKATKVRVLSTPPREENMKFNPITGVYNDSRMYQPSPATLANSLRQVTESETLKQADKDFITNFVDKLADRMSVNERAVVTENLRIVIGRFRANQEPWTNLKAVLQGQVKFDVMNVSDYMETQIRKDANLLHKLKQADYIDPVLGPIQLQDLHDNFISNIIAKNQWEDGTAPRIAKELRGFLDLSIPVKLRVRLDANAKDNFYLRFAKRLALADSPDRDQVAVSLGRDLYNLANYRGSRNEWYNLGVKLLDDANSKGFYQLETFGVQKRRMKSRMSGKYFGQYYDTFAVNIRVVDPRIQKYAKLTRKVEFGLRVPTTETNRLLIREGYKTYFVEDNLLGLYDTRIPIISTSAFSDFPTSIIDKDMVAALNWTASAQYKIDPEFHDFISKLINFQDDKGKAQYYHDLNKYREFLIERGDSYERLKAMEWLKNGDKAFSNTPFLDHRARIYERGLIGPQSGEVFRPYLNTAEAKNFSELGFLNLQDQIGAYLSGESDVLEHKFNGLSIQGRQQIAALWRKDLVQLGDQMRRGKPNDIRAILENKLMQEIDGEDQGKLMRFALEMSRINEYLGGKYDSAALQTLKDYKISLALEQDASSSGAQIIALTTKNKQLAELSNVVPTIYKRRLYDEIANTTFNSPEFRKLNERLGLNEKDLRKAAKAQNMVTLYGAGKRTGILAIESKLGKALGKEENFLVVTASDRDKVLAEISARMARYEKIDTETYLELKALRQDVKEIFNKGQKPNEEIMDQLYFLDSKTRDVVEKMTRTYDQVVTPNDFQAIAEIMSAELKTQVPILNDFTKFHGRLAEDFLLHAKPAGSQLDYASLLSTQLLGAKRAGKKLPKWLSTILAIKDESLRDKFLNRIPGYVPGSTVSELLTGVKAPTRRRTGFKIGKFSLFSEDITPGMEVGIANKLDKNWSNVPSVNFDGKVLEQNYTQVFEEKLMYKDKDGNWVTNILQVPQKTSGNAWEEFRNKDGKINEIADVTHAKTAYGVSTNHSNDAVIAKRSHLWGKANNVQTSSVHDAFVSNAADMIKLRQGLREIYADAVDTQSIKATLDELLARGLPKDLYDKYLNEAMDIGLIPVAGRSIVGGKILTEKGILKRSDVLKETKENFKDNYAFYGIG